MTEATVKVQDLQQYKVMIATPMYGGSCSGHYTNSCIKLALELTNLGIKFGFDFLFNESLITRARNFHAENFLSSDNEYTHLVFIDSDIEFNAKDIVSMLVLQHSFPDRQIICAPYPKKSISWEKVAAAVNKGVADENPFVLENYCGDYVINISPDVDARLDQMIEVAEAGTGCMMITRKVFEDYAKAYPELKYLPDHHRTENFNGSKEIMCFFDAAIDPESRRYLSEDYFFCRKAAKIGHKTWLVPWLQVNHIGTYRFVGNLNAVASIGEAVTVEAKHANKQHKYDNNRRRVAKNSK